MLAHKDAYVFGNLTCTARRAIARIARYARAMRKKPELAQASDECRGNKRNVSVACLVRIAKARQRVAIRTFIVCSAGERAGVIVHLKRSDFDDT